MLLEIVLPCFHAGDSLLLKLLWGCLSADRRLFLSSQWSVRPFRCWIYVVSAIATRSFYQYHSAGYTQFLCGDAGLFVYRAVIVPRYISCIVALFIAVLQQCAKPSLGIWISISLRDRLSRRRLPCSLHRCPECCHQVGSGLAPRDRIMRRGRVRRVLCKRGCRCVRRRPSVVHPEM